MVTIILKETAAPGNTEKYGNVSSVNGTGTNSGVQATDQAAFVTGAGANPWLALIYVDDNGTTQRRTISANDVKTVI